MTIMKNYSGHGGGGTTSGGTTSVAAVRTPDNLRSNDAFEIILGLGEGEWDACEQFLVGDTALINASGAPNFADMNLYFYPGLANPPTPIIPTLGGLSRGVNVGVTLAYNVPVVRTTETYNIDFIDIRLVFQQLFLQNDTGTYNNSCSFFIEVKPESATTWTNPYNQSITITGKTTSTYVKELRIPVSRVNEGYNIRVTKLTQESDTLNFITVAWEGFEEVTSGQYTWPNTAIAHLTGRATNQFTSMPQFSGVYRGMKVKVPTNYDPVARTYSGTWDGTFKIAWTNNPAWCLYDYVTDDRYGASTYFPVFVDKYSAYEAARWCDAVMSDGRPRYTFNQLIAESRSAREQAIYMAGVFNGVFFDDQDGTAYIKVDKEESARHLFAEENTIEGFSYSFSDLTTRYNDITVSFTNPDLGYQTDRRRVKNDADIALNGRVTYDFIAVGCDNAPEAVRRAAYKMLTSLTETMSVTFRTNRKGSFVQPWEIILIADATLGYSISGRVKSLDQTRKIITLRDPIYLEAGISYTLRFDSMGEVIERSMNSPTSGSVTAITLTQALPEGLPEFCTFSLAGGTLGLPKPFRVMKLTEVEGNVDLYEIQAIEVNRNKWDQADNYEDTTVVDYSGYLGAIVKPVINIAFEQSLVSTSLTTRMDLLVTWDDISTAPVNSYEVWYRKNLDPWTVMTPALDKTTTIVDVSVGEYDVKVITVGKGGYTSAASEASYTVGIPDIKPPPVTGLELTGQGNDITFVGKDAVFDWRWTGLTGGGSLTQAADSGWRDSFFKGYIVRVYNTNGRLLRAEPYQTETSYTYTHEKNIADGPVREFVVGVSVIDIYGRESMERKLQVKNEAPKAPTGLKAEAAYGAVIVSFTPDPATDVVGSMIWASSVSGFTPSVSNLVFDGSSNQTWIDVPDGGTAYFRVATYDTFGKENLNLSSEISATSLVVEPPDGSITKSKLYEDLATEIDTNTNLVTSIKGQYTVKVDVDGYVSGYGLATTAVNGVPTSAFGIRADSFWVAAPGTENQILPFSVVDGQVYIEGAHIKSASVGSAAIGSLSATKITSGTITSDDINIGDAKFKLNGTSQQLLVNDGNVDRVVMGKFGTNDYGFKIFDNAGNLIVGTGGVGPGLVCQSANIGNAQVNTLKLAGNSVTIPVLATSAYDHPAGTTYSSEVVSVSFTSSGAPKQITYGGLLIVNSAEYSRSSPSSAGSWNYGLYVPLIFYMALWRITSTNSTLLEEFKVEVPSQVVRMSGDNVSTGTTVMQRLQLAFAYRSSQTLSKQILDFGSEEGVVTYALKIKVSLPATSDYTAVLTSPSISVLEVKR